MIHLLPQPPECWDYRHKLPYQVCIMTKSILSRGLLDLAGSASNTHESYSSPAEPGSNLLARTFWGAPFSSSTSQKHQTASSFPSRFTFAFLSMGLHSLLSPFAQVTYTSKHTEGMSSLVFFSSHQRVKGKV